MKVKTFTESPYERKMQENLMADVAMLKEIVGDELIEAWNVINIITGEETNEEEEINPRKGDVPETDDPESK